MGGRWNSDPAVSGGGVLVDNGTHSVDLVRYLLGPDRRGAGGGDQPAAVGFAVDDTARLHLRTDAGIDAHVDLSWSIDKSLADFLRIYGTLGEIRVGWRESAWRLHGGEWEVIGTGYAKGPAMGGALDAFCRAVRGEAPLAVTVDDGIAAATCIDAAYESLRRGGWVKLAEPRRPGGPVDDRRRRAHPPDRARRGRRRASARARRCGTRVHIRGPGTTIGDDCIVGEKSYVAYGVRHRRPGEDQRLRLHLHGRHDRGRRDDLGRHHVHQRPLPAGHHARPAKLRPSDPDEHTLPTIVRAGTTIGARATIGPGIELGRFSMVGMAAAVTRSVPDFHLVVGHPARTVAAVCRCGEPFLRAVDGLLPDADAVECGACGLATASSHAVSCRQRCDPVMADASQRIDRGGWP